MTNQPIPEHPSGDKIRLFDAIRPPLSQGQFDVKMQQSFPAVVDGVTTGMSEQTQVRRIEVGGSRWSIDSLCVHSRTPPRNEQNVRLDLTLPKIVFQKKTLPWERTVDSSNEDAPWMGLLLLREDEFEDGYCEILKDATSHDILGSTSSPLIQIQALRITEKLLKAVGPLQSELQLLAHGLQVNPKNKELCGTDEDGLFSVVLSNRLPSEADTKYHACLVSYEGFFDKLPTNATYITQPATKKSPAKEDTGKGKMLFKVGETLAQQTSVGSGFSGTDVKLVLLDHWTFKTGDGGDFESRIKQIQFRSKESDSEATGELASVYDFAEAGSFDSVYEPALLGNDMDPDVSTNSYLLTEIVEDDGITRSCLYRGPCIAVPTNHEPKEEPYKNSDDARGLEPSTGLDVIHHSAAFELGRLLALSDKNFIHSLNRWRRLWIDKQNQADYRTAIIQKQADLDRFTAEELNNLPISSLVSTGLLKKASKIIPAVAEKSDYPLQGIDVFFSDEIGADSDLSAELEEGLSDAFPEGIPDELPPGGGIDD